jgi:hypothetical protein
MYTSVKECNIHFTKNKKGKVIPVINKTPLHEDVFGELRYSSTVLD